MLCSTVMDGTCGRGRPDVHYQNMLKPLRRLRTIATFLIGLSGVAVLGFGIATVSPGYIILGLLIVFASAPLLARRS